MCYYIDREKYNLFNFQVERRCEFISCCLLSETYGRNEVTPIFRPFHRAASSTTGGWSSWNILMCYIYIYIYIYIYHSEHYGIILGGCHIIFTRSPLFHFFCVHFHSPFTPPPASTPWMCVMYLTPFDGIF